MIYLAIATGLLVALNVAVAFLTALGKKRLRRTLARLVKIRDEKVSCLEELVKRRQSMEDTRDFLKNRGEVIQAELDQLQEELAEWEQEEGGEIEQEAAEEQEGEGTPDVESAAEAATQAEGAVQEPSEKKIRTRLDQEEEEAQDNAFRPKKKIRTRFPNERGGELF
jgi:hypothetical protein